ncbi:restriction endonuclease subunit S [Methylomonas sp. LW13]|nr:restriction endonuclease subunit S [Methylomonas sp. LW13]
MQADLRIFKGMSAIQQLLTEHLDLWTAADTAKKSGRGRGAGTAASVYGIKKLRELILELAVRGKLVPQDANDEPASELLKRIQAEKAKLIAEGKIKKDKALAPITEKEMPFNLPQRWRWVRLGEVLDMVNGRAFKPTDWIAKGLPIVRIQNLNNSDAVFNYCDETSVVDRHIIDNGSFLISWSGTPGTSFGAFIWNGGKAALNQHIFSCFQIGEPYFDKFLAMAINARLEELIAKAHGGVGLQHVTKGKLEALALILPPLAEQHRIVAKVDELMALCDQLETQHINAAEAHEKLVSHLLGTLTSTTVRPELVEGPLAKDAAHASTSSAFMPYRVRTESFAENWQRIAAHFDTLFTTEASIDALKQTLLQLAVMGKLVPQDPNDEPASELLKRIQVEKAKLIAEGKIKKDKPLPLITGDEKPFDLPQGWQWVRLADLLALVTDGDHQAPPKSESGVPFLVIGNLNTGDVLLEGCRFVTEEYYEKLDWGKKPSRNDLLYTVTGSYGIPIKVNVSDRFCVQRHVAILKVVQSTPTNYLAFLLKSKYAFQYATEIATGIAQKTVPLSGLRIMPIALPTGAEQHRIVAKVEELMALCDQLKARLAAANQLQQKLADGMVERAIMS